MDATMCSLCLIGLKWRALGSLPNPRHDQFSRLILEQFCTAPEPDGAAVDECDPQALHELGLVFFRSKKYVRHTDTSSSRPARAHLYLSIGLAPSPTHTNNLYDSVLVFNVQVRRGEAILGACAARHHPAYGPRRHASFPQVASDAFAWALGATAQQPRVHLP